MNVKNFNFLFLHLITHIILNIKIIQTYNFVDKQNPEIDEIYSQIPGFQSYSFTSNNSTLLIFDIYPDSKLTINFKIYSNDTILKSLLENKYQGLIIGFEFPFNSTRAEDGDKYKTDTMICSTNFQNSSCLDYFYSVKDEKFFKNQIENSNNFLIPSKNKILFLNYFQRFSLSRRY